ncbi:cell division protein FtsQ [Murinocardiopsis flavida]|uniref:Cell division protein FtsQ n=1 Tax=Murinocardiopsis flavida TaxID=645275 RepID=A0A2P8D3L7_9ACTN|nr:FtsQ-type POTRA domain-containing protein [Murinocardiopsis flavida]PSK91804.1 cell division protein FtsQ [Murinocardiopsis flavida]
METPVETAVETAVETPAADPAAARPRRSDPWKVAFVILLIVALLAVVTWVLLGSRLLVVREVHVGGGERIAKAEVVKAVGVPTGTPLATVDTGVAQERVEELRLVESAEVARSWPATLRVTIIERTPQLAVRVGSGFQLVDHDGVRVDDAEERPEPIPQVLIKGAVAGNKAIADAAAITDALPSGLRGRVESVDARDRAAITVEFADGGSVVWGDATRLSDKARTLEVLVGKHPSNGERRYDVSAPGMAVVK